MSNSRCGCQLQPHARFADWWLTLSRFETGKLGYDEGVAGHITVRVSSILNRRTSATTTPGRVKGAWSLRRAWQGTDLRIFQDPIRPDCFWVNPFVSVMIYARRCGEPYELSVIGQALLADPAKRSHPRRPPWNCANSGVWPEHFAEQSGVHDPFCYPHGASRCQLRCTLALGIWPGVLHFGQRARHDHAG